MGSQQQWLPGVNLMAPSPVHWKLPAHKPDTQLPHPQLPLGAHSLGLLAEVFLKMLRLAALLSLMLHLCSLREDQQHSKAASGRDGSWKSLLTSSSGLMCCSA